MTSWHRNRRGRGCTTPRCRSQNIANNTFSEGWLQKSKEFAGLRTAPATHHAKNTANTTFSCGMLQNAGFGTIPCGGGGGSEPRTGNIYEVLLYQYLSWGKFRLLVCFFLWNLAQPAAVGYRQPPAFHLEALHWAVLYCQGVQHLKESVTGKTSHRWKNIPFWDRYSKNVSVYILSTLFELYSNICN